MNVEAFEAQVSDVIATADKFGDVRPDYLFTEITEEMEKLGIIETYEIDSPIATHWQRVVNHD